MSMLLKYVKVFTLLIASFFIFSVLSSLLPYKYVQKNIEKSIPELLEEGNYPKVILKGDRYRQDNFTDALILNIIASSDSKRPVWSAMVNPYSFQSPDDPNKWYAVKNLDHKVQNMDLSPNILYGRYWHGSAAACKFLLLIMDYQQLKWFLYIVSTLLLLLFAVRIVNKVGWIKSLPLFLALLFANFFVIQFAIQFFPVMAIALAGGIWMCKNGHKSQKKITMCLLIIGMLTAYFDLLTTPLLTLGIPLIVYMILQGEEKKSAYDFFKSIFILCLAWLIGYAGAWATKWILINIFTDATAIYAIDAIKWNAKAKDYTRWDAIVRNFNLIPLVWLNIILTFLLLLTFFSFNKKGISFAIAFLIVGLFPYIWYFVLSGHSYTHWWFTYRAQMISMSCIMLFFVFLIDWERIKLKMRIKNWKSKIKNHYKIKNTVKIILRIINKMVNILKPFLIVALLFIISGIIFNTVETFIFYKYQDFIPFSTIIQSYFNIIAVFCLYSLILLPFYLFITLLNQKTAQILISILFALLISLEIGLYVYYTQAGVLMGRELVIRPLSETLVTIRNSSNIIINSILIVIVLACFIALPFVLKKVKIFNHYRSSIVTVIIIGILSACTLFYQRDGNQIVNNYLESKSFFFFSALKNHSIDETGSDYFLFDEEGNFEKIEKNEEILRKYVALYNKTAEDLDYPMECFSSEIPD
ncbi:MAG: hypothetical protein FWC41_06090, partial [Firmicutes bacterium]|nr:hypothetical protein [Bacillota bacterium]